MDGLYLCDYYGSETLEQEFKVFIWNKIYQNGDIAKRFLLNWKWTNYIQKWVFISLRKYIKRYFPKYFACFCNTKIDGDLILGIDDNGTILGVPSKIPITKNIIMAYIKKYIGKEYIKGTKSILEKIEITIQKCNTDLMIKDIERDPTFEIDRNYQTYLKVKKIYEKKIQEYLQARKRWDDNMEKYRTLVGIVNKDDTFYELCDYIKAHKNTEKIMETINENRPFILPEHEEMQRRKKDKKDFLYWLTDFKDYIVMKNVKLRPNMLDYRAQCKKEYNMSQRFSPLQLFYNFTSFHRKLLFTNQDINFYVVKIKIKGSLNNKNIYYKDKTTNEWRYRSREINDLGPFSL